MWEQDCSAATENLLIEAELLGLGAVWLGVHPLTERVEGLRALLGIPESVVPFAVVSLGWPAQRKEPSDRFDAALRPRRALVAAGGRRPGPPSCSSPGRLSRPRHGYLWLPTRDAAGAALRPGAGETGSAPRVGLP